MDNIKSACSVALAEEITRRGITQKEAGRITGLDQNKISCIVNGKTEGFTIDRLFKCLLDMGIDVTVEFGSDELLGGVHKDSL